MGWWRMSSCRIMYIKYSIGNAKRFMAYEIIKRLEQANEQNILNYLPL